MGGFNHPSSGGAALDHVDYSYSDQRRHGVVFPRACRLENKLKMSEMLWRIFMHFTRNLHLIASAGTRSNMGIAGVSSGSIILQCMAKIEIPCASISQRNALYPLIGEILKTPFRGVD